MKLKKPTRKTVTDVAAITTVVGATAATLVVGLKVQRFAINHSLMKMQLNMALTLIDKVEQLHPHAMADAVTACDKDLIEALVAHTS